MKTPTTVIVLLLVAACASPSTAATTSSTAPTTTSTTTTAPTTTVPTTTTVAPSTTTTESTTTTIDDPLAPPDWLGTRVLPLRDDGFGEIQPTPPELDPRAIRTVDLLPPPTGTAFQGTSEPVPDDVLARSSWSPDCPVTRDELSYVTVSFWGFDGDRHTGELLVNADAAGPLIQVFQRLYELHFPIEEMRIVRADELDLPPTGDGNDTTAFVCRPVVGATSWSQHAYGLAVDLNPFHNPYVKGDLVLPELASTYVDRDNVRPGMVTPDVVAAFGDIGWGWGGDWNSLKDWMHFSSNGT